MDRELSTRILPMVPLRGLIVFPNMVLNFDAGREKSVKAIETAMLGDKYIFLATQKDDKVENPSVKDCYTVGTVCKIKQLLKMPGDVVRVLVDGVRRASYVRTLSELPFVSVEVEELYEEDIDIDIEMEAYVRKIIEAFEEYVSLSPKVSPELLITVSDMVNPSRIADFVASQVQIKLHTKQEILEAFDTKIRMEILLKNILKELEILDVEKKIGIRVKKQIDRLQKEYYLREQIKAIQKELGDKDGLAEEIEEYRLKASKLKAPKEVKEKLEKEIDRLSKLPTSSAESGGIRNYIEWVLELPWNNCTKDKFDLKFSRRVLEEDHFGLDSVKERVIEYLAVKKLAKDMKGPILCLVGPPGVGKTSIAKSIARAMNRKFVRMSLGGVRDEAEIRGHRRTYIGAIPGRIIYSIKQAGSSNPVFLFDEIDKLASDFRGDPASALLEVLDAEQNKDFRDHYLELPYDLSKVTFITTANTTTSIPRPLLDRMEIISISGYTEEEKLSIAKKYLLPKQLKENGLTQSNLKLSDLTLRAIINSYTREAGVRNLEREIGKVCRKAAAKLLEESKSSVRVNDSNLEGYLGIPKYRHDLAKEVDEVGTVKGLAWTPVGGDTLSIEVTLMRGDGKLVLTGQLGEVMKESAKAGLSYIRSKSDSTCIDENFHKEKDIHIHIPEGAIPKDGPSAGISMATAMISAITGIAVRKDVAMTGEITLRGKVLPIGGVKEKVLAAHRAGIKKVLLPLDNAKDAKEIPDIVLKKVEIVYVETMDQVLAEALIKDICNESK